VSRVGSGIFLSGQPGRREVREECSRWLQSVFGSSEELTLGTFTFRNLDIERYQPGLQRVMIAGQKLVDKLVDNGMSVFVAVEAGTVTRRLHLHSLSNCAKETLIALVAEEWREKYGHRKIDVVHSRGGVSDYVTKYITKSDMPFFAAGPLFLTFREPTVSAGGPA